MKTMLATIILVLGFQSISHADQYSDCSAVTDLVVKAGYDYDSAVRGCVADWYGWGITPERTALIGKLYSIFSQSVVMAKRICPKDPTVQRLISEMDLDITKNTRARFAHVPLCI
jgi:hypothetical protein